MNDYGIMILPSGCKIGSKPHGPHEWYEGFFRSRKVTCIGIPEPGYDYQGNPVILRHKHSLKLTKWTWGQFTPWGKYDQVAVLTFTCLDDECSYSYDIYRWKYDRLVLGNQPKEYGHWPT